MQILHFSPHLAFISNEVSSQRIKERSIDLFLGRLPFLEILNNLTYLPELHPKHPILQGNLNMPKGLDTENIRSL